MHPLVSIIVNNYNYERYLAEAIESALNQYYPHIEVWVVDDGSTDGSRQLIEKYVPHVRPIYKQNGGQASAFNRGFQEAKGDLILFLDADDVLFPNAVQKGVACWHSGVSAVQWPLQGLDASGQLLEIYFPQQNRNIPENELARYVARYGMYPHPPTSGLLFSREALEAIMPIDEKFWRISADAPLYTAVPFLGKVVFINEPLGYYRLHGNNLWNNPKPNVERTRRRIMHDLEKAKIIRQYAEKLGIKPSPYLGHSNPYILLDRILIHALGIDLEPGYKDTLGRLVMWGIQASFICPSVPFFRRRIRLAINFLEFLLARDKNEILRIILSRRYPESTPEQIESYIQDLLLQAHKIKNQEVLATPQIGT